jgi:hypothetical protein
MIKGYVYDSSSKKVLSPVSIENLTTHQGTFTNAKGEFQLEAKMGDYLYFTYVGFKNKSIKVKEDDLTKSIEMYMSLKPVQLKDVTIYRGPTEYQKDSANRASIYKSAFEYEQQKSVMTPVTSIYQKFSKKYKNLRKFQDQIQDMERQKFIDTRYNTDLVKVLTKLPDDSVSIFMNQYPIEYDFVRAASDLEIKMWIKYNYQEFISKKKK